MGPETHPDREALMATLSCSMVGPMDGLGLLNASRVLATARADGRVLRPDRPLTISDACFRKEPAACFEYETYTDLPGLGRVVYVFANEPGALHPALPPGAKAVYNWYTGTVTRADGALTPEPGYEGHVYAVVVPVLPNGWVFLGEVGKYVPLSRARFERAEATPGGVEAEVAGVAGETVQVCAYLHTTRCQAVHFARTETRLVTFAEGLLV